MALGPLRLRPSELGQCTVVEVLDMIDGHLWRDEAEWERTAWAVANLLNVSGKTLRHRVTVRKLLGRGISPGMATPDQAQALMDAIKKSKAPDD